jgi:hypothetical protein
VHRKGFRVTIMTLVTTLLDAVLYPVEAFAQLSWARWGDHPAASCEVSNPRWRTAMARQFGGVKARVSYRWPTCQ